MLHPDLLTGQHSILGWAKGGRVMAKIAINPKQREVVETIDGPVLVIAGPGSGKTTTLVDRVFYIIETRQVAPENLLVATFTEKAAAELITRISNRLHEAGIKFNLNEMYIGTIHSLCLRFLEEYREFTRLKRSYTLMDEFDQQYFIYNKMKEFDKMSGIELLTDPPSEKSRWKRSEKLVQWLNKVSEEALDLAALMAAPEAEVRVLADCYQLYEQMLAEANALDLSTIQLEALRLLESQPEVLQALQQKIQYLMIDEYQDTNTIQEFIMLKLAGDQANICVVGDDDQGLYRFRGATIRNILEFPQQFAAGRCQVKTLTVNYRSHPEIVSFYNAWMTDLNWSHGGQNFRYAKTIEPQPGKFPKSSTVLKVSGQDSPASWHQEVLDFLHTMRDSGKLSDWNQVAFLFRSVKGDGPNGAVELANYLEQNGIPVYSPRSNMFFQREEIRLIIGAFLFIFPWYMNNRQWDPKIELGIWDYYDECFREFATQLRQTKNKDLLKWCQQRAAAHNALSKNSDYGFSGLFYQLLQFPMFSRFLGLQADGGVIDSRPARNLGVFSQLLGKFEYLHRITVLTPKWLEKNLLDLFNNYMRYLQDGGLNEYEDDTEYAPSGCVSFLTIHQSKGLEFPVVIVGSMEGIPRKQYTDLDEILQDSYYHKKPFEPLDQTKYYDFWRLYYTAFSRAQNLLVLSCREHMPQGKGDKRVPSKYLEDPYDRAIPWGDASFHLDRLKLETIKDINIKREYSFTADITPYETCAFQYRFFRELGFVPVRQAPILFGTLVHQTIEDIHKAALRGEPHLINQSQIETWFNDNYLHLSKKERVYLAPQTQRVALEQVVRYVDNQKGDWSRLREAEVEVALVKDAYILKGKIDLIAGQGGTVEIIDFKSEQKPDLKSERDIVERYRRQLEVYAHVVEERMGLTVSGMHLYYTAEENGSPYISFKKNKTSIDGTITTIDNIVARIENKDYRITHQPGGKTCANCDIRHHCDNL